MEDAGDEEEDAPEAHDGNETGYEHDDQESLATVEGIYLVLEMHCSLLTSFLFQKR
jgi:hypothetical protein